MYFSFFHFVLFIFRNIKVHLKPEQIKIDVLRQPNESDEEYYKSEIATMNAEYDAREEYRLKHGKENIIWKQRYESEYDRNGIRKPAYKGNRQ